MIFTDLNNYRYATGFSAMIQEHFGLLQEGKHETMENFPCYTCMQIQMMDQAGTLDGIVIHGFGEFDLRPYDVAPLEGWWDYASNRVDPAWLKKYVYEPVAV